MKRRFVNLVMHRWYEGVYSLRRIDPYRLFFRSANAALEAADEAAKRKEFFPAMQPLQLPPSSMNFTTTPAEKRLNFFALLSSRPTCEGRMVLANAIGESVMYDADKRLIGNLCRLNKSKGLSPVCLPIVHPGADEESLYVMHKYPGQDAGGCFEVLEYMPENPELSDLMACWRWRLLPPPPFVRQHSYYEPCYDQPSANITSYTTILDSNGYSTICVSCAGDFNDGTHYFYGQTATRPGTYSFQTARRDSSHRLGWRHSEKWKHVGDWTLPFVGGAQYVSEFDLWFGFSASWPGNLCAADLSAMDTDRQPALQQDWQDVSPPEGQVWLPASAKLLNLGDGKFLVARTFEVEATGQRFALLTGVEMMHDADDGKRLRMVKHKCAWYAFRNETIYWVL
jgi:hypothetical protein